MDAHESLNLTDEEIAAALANSRWADKAVLTIEEAAELARVSVETIYDWSSRGCLKGCACKVGKRLKFFRDRWLKRIFNEGINDVS